MSNVVVLMTWNLERWRACMPWLDRAFEVFWRIAVILLPWQTRWFHEGPMLGGYPWEGGRVSMYVSWVPIIATVIFGYLRRGDIHVARPTVDRCTVDEPGGHKCLPYIFIAIMCSIYVSTYRLATIQWWVEVLLLASFVWTLVREVRRDDLMRWIVYAIIPHAVLGVMQHLTQTVVGSKWLGMAYQNPLTPGVSIVEAVGRRWLRAYGGFPHPNILGGWLVLGVGCLLSLVRAGLKPAPTCLISGLFAGCLVFTFSRSAWLALAVLMFATTIAVFRSNQMDARRGFFLACATMFVVMGGVVVWRWPLVMTRSGSQTRLEQRSVDERALGFRNGLELFKRHPWIGTGPRTTSFALVQEGIVSPSTIPIPPHNVFLLMLDEVGILGMLLIVGFVIWLFRRACVRRFKVCILLFSFLPILLLDHYPWSTWSGLALIALVAINLSFHLSSLYPQADGESSVP